MGAKKSNTSVRGSKQSLRTARSIEDQALKALMVVAPSVLALTLVVSGLMLGVSALPITGRPSMSIFISLSSSLIAFGLFLSLYPRAVAQAAPNSYLVSAKRSVRWFDAVSLGIVYALIVFALTVLSARVMAASFEGLQFDIYTASVLVGIACGLVAYGVVRMVGGINSNQIINVLALFLVGGVTLSMLTAQDPLWWEANFSTLGQSTQRGTASFYAFNFTLIFSALAIIVLARHLYADMQALMEQGSLLGVSKTNAVKTIFVVAALGLGGVGLFFYKPDSLQGTLHVISAGLVALAFGALMILLKWLLPGLSKPFMTISYIALAALVTAYVFFTFVGYLSLTAFELGCFGICFGWLYLFTQQIVGQGAINTTLMEA